MIPVIWSRRPGRDSPIDGPTRITFAAPERVEPLGLEEITELGRTLKKCATHVLTHFDRPGTSNGPTETINGRLEHLPGSAPGFSGT